jgi:hypothetical protein
LPVEGPGGGMGANGRQVGQTVGEILGVPTYDREIVQHIADTAHVDDPLLYDLVLNSGDLDNEGCAQIVAAAYHAKFKG